jgi:biotin carboxylase
MAVSHEGGIFVTETLENADPASVAARELNARLLETFSLRLGASHSEFIRTEDGRWYFLETSARVGGAYIVDTIEAATGVNLWREWAKAEIAGDGGRYEAPSPRSQTAGIVLTLARQEVPDTSAYRDPEIVKRIVKRHHAGLIVASPDSARVSALIDDYVRRFYADFHASAPPPVTAVD